MGLGFQICTGSSSRHYVRGGKAQSQVKSAEFKVIGGKDPWAPGLQNHQPRGATHKSGDTYHLILMKERWGWGGEANPCKPKQLYNKGLGQTNIYI